MSPRYEICIKSSINMLFAYVYQLGEFGGICFRSTPRTIPKVYYINIGTVCSPGIEPVTSVTLAANLFVRICFRRKTVKG